MNYTLEQIIELAKEVETTDAIDWESLPIDKDSIYQLVGSQAYELYALYANGTEDGEAIIVATLTKLLVENFVLNLKVESR
jgi:hypothetical protein